MIFLIFIAICLALVELLLIADLYLHRKSIIKIIKPKRTYSIQELFIPDAIIKTYYDEEGRHEELTYKVVKIDDDELVLVLYHCNRPIYTTSRLIKGLMKWETRCEVYHDNILMAVFREHQEPVYYGFNFKRKIKINKNVTF